MKHHAFVMYGPDPEGNPFVGVFIGTTTSNEPKIPLGARRLCGPYGSFLFDSRKDAVDEAIVYLTAERTVSEADALKRKIR